MRRLLPRLTIVLLALVGRGHPAAARQSEAPGLTPLQSERVERLLETRIACLGCHTIGGRGGWIGPSLDGVSQRVERDYLLAVVRDPQGTIPGTLMPHQPLPDAERRHLVSYLLSLPATSTEASATPEAPPALTPEDRYDGAALYARHCAACHGETGRGDGWNAANLPVQPTAHADAAAMSLRPDDTLYDGIHGGGYVLDKSARMPAFGAMLEPRQIRALIRHIRDLCDCEQPTWAGGGP
jgi:mono/diheme cytochrome c family protein